MNGIHIIKATFWILIAVVVAATTAVARPFPGDEPVPERPRPSLAQSPQPITVDQVIHNKGNILTTVDNYGYIGGWSYYDLPSGEYPRNSGRDYIGELKYWMGAVTPANDTIVANSDDDFQAMPSVIDGQEQYSILLSTDSSRYYSWDLTDTAGLGVGNPAQGWRVWDGETDQWVYNETYNVLASAFSPTGPTSLQESHYRFSDNANGDPLGLEITQTIMQWNYCYNEDFIFVVLEITNVSANDYTDFAFGVYSDIDVGGPDGTGENGRLEDMVAFDSTENLAWTYDDVGYDPGWGVASGPTGIMGTKYLETPDDIGMTAFRTDDWAIVTDIDDQGRYDLINSTQFDASLPPTDQFYIQCTRGINLTAGKTVRVVYALIAGDDEADFLSNAQMAQQLYDNYFVGPQPPTTPILKVTTGDQKVYLHWTDTSEVGVDPLSLVNDFAGYKLYRSDNQGRTWGTPIYNTGNDCLTQDYATIAAFNVASPGDPIPHTYVDTDLHNGVEYWYCLSAVDVGDTITGVDALQSGFGLAGEVANIVAATPKSNPSGYYDATGTVEHVYNGSEWPSEGNVFPAVFDQSQLLGADYRVVFQDEEDDTYWHLINVTTGDTVLSDQTQTGGDPNLFEVSEGLRVVVTNGDRIPRSYEQTAFAGTDTTMAIANYYGPTLPWLTWDDTYLFGDAIFRSTFELRYTGDSTRATSVVDPWYGTDLIYWVGLEAWNVTTNQRVSLAVYDFEDDGVWDPYDPLTIVDYPYNATTSVTDSAFPNYYSWMFDFDETTYAPAVGDVVTIEGAPLNGPLDAFTFKVDGINDAAARANLKNIRVVPNPYLVQYSAMVETSDGESILEFQEVPGECTIRIYTLAGDLVATVDHSDGTGVARWNLMSSDSRLVSSGIYIYHVESEYGEHLGRLAIIK